MSSRVGDMSTDVLETLETLAGNAGEEQVRVLSEILTLNARTLYVQSLRLQPSHLPTSFKHLAPLITYDDIKPLIQRIVDGDPSPLLTAHPISLLFLSSGTSSGEPRFIPTHDDDMERRYNVMFSILPALLARDLQKAGLVKDNATRTLTFFFVKREFRSPGGLPVRTFVTNLCRSKLFCTFAPSTCTSPVEVFQSEDVLQSMYCHLLCGLLQRSEVGRVDFAFASGLLHVMHFLEQWWGELVRDIHGGTLSNDVVSDPIVRRSVEALIATSGGPNPALAQELDAEFRRHPTWQGIIRRLWPQAKFVCAVVTGSMSQYVSILDFYTGGLPLVTVAYASSEGYFGVNLAPLCPVSDISYMLLPNMAYFEFLPCPTIDESRYMNSTVLQHDQIQSTSQETTSASLIDLVDVKLGEAYELVVTTYAGLYRYRTCDVLRVTGFYKEAPLFQFVRRANVLLSIDVDKTDEETLQKAVAAATSAHLEVAGWRLVDYTSYADISTAPGHYVLFWEVRREGKVADEDARERQLDVQALEACCLEMEENLGFTYRRGRVLQKNIGALEIRVVEEGTFNVIMEMLCEQQASMKGSSISQYKMRRCINKQSHAPILDLLNSRVSAFASSPQCPSLPSQLR